jgi:hypothetical protein
MIGIASVDVRPPSRVPRRAGARREIAPSRAATAVPSSSRLSSDDRRARFDPETSAVDASARVVGYAARFFRGAMTNARARMRVDV